MKFTGNHTLSSFPFLLGVVLLSVSVIGLFSLALSGCSSPTDSEESLLSSSSDEGSDPGGDLSSSSGGGGDVSSSGNTPGGGDSSDSPGAGSGNGTIQDTGDCGTETGTITAQNGCIRYTGRVHNNTAESRVDFNWPGIVIQAKFQGTSVALSFEGGDNVWFDAYIDGNKVETIPPPDGKTNDYTLGSVRIFSGVTSYLLSNTLSDGEHTLRVVKRSETNFSVVSFKGLVLDAGKSLLPLPPRPDRRIEIIGDSYSVGYGNESPDKSNPAIQGASGRTCSDEEFHAYTNSELAYGPLAAELLGAEYQLNAYSGLGMVRNYSGNTAYLPFPGYYDRVLQNSETPYYDPQTWHPHVIIILLGTNDFSTALGGGEAFESKEALQTAYKARYKEFLAKLRNDHPGVQFILGATNLWDDVANAPNTVIQDKVQEIISEENAAGHNDMTYQLMTNSSGYGCGWHPEKKTHGLWGNALSNRIKSIMGWD